MSTANIEILPWGEGLCEIKRAPRIAPDLYAFITETVSAKHGITVEDIRGKCKQAKIVKARHVCLWLIRIITGHTYERIAVAFNIKHGTVIHAQDAINNRHDTDSEFALELNSLLSQIQQTIN